MRKIICLLCAAICAQLPILHTAAQPPQDTEAFFFREKEAEVPIIMYHLITENPKYIGKYGVTPADVEKDLLYLKENGYTTIVMQDLIHFVERGKRLPKKPIVLTFDDGNTSDYTCLFPLLQKHKAKAVLAIIGDPTDRYTNTHAQNPKAKFPNMTWEQVKELHDSKLCEIQSHGYNVHGKGGSGKKNGEGTEAYRTRLSADLQKLQDACKAHLDWTPTTFVYPLGVVGKGSRQIIEDLGMAASLGCEEGINIVRQGDRDSLFQMYRYNRPHGEPVEAILKRAQVKG